MFKKTAVAVGLAMVAGTGMAVAQSDSSMGHDSGMASNQMSSNHMSMNRMSSNSMSSSGMSSNGMSSYQQNSEGSMSASSSGRALFERLDTNRDGVLSRSEAASSDRINNLYDSMDTNETIENSAKNSGSGGITLDQFEAGLQAAKNGGVVGQPVSGGENDGAHGTMSRMRNTSENQMSGMQDNAMSRGSQMGNSMRANTMHRMQRSSNTMSDSGNSMQSNEMQN